MHVMTRLHAVEVPFALVNTRVAADRRGVSIGTKV